MISSRAPGVCCRLLILLLCSGTGAQHAAGQIKGGNVTGDPALTLGTFTIEDGLSVNQVTDVFQDSKGLLWIATIDGLNRYDGFNFKTYRHIPGDATSLSNDYISTNAIAEDSKGYLWIGTRRGVNRYDPYRDVFTGYTHHPDSSGGLSHDRVMGIHIDATDQVWLATLGGLDVLDPETGRFKHVRHDPENDQSLPSNMVLSIEAGDNETLWVGTEAGLGKLSMQSDKVERLYAEDLIWSLQQTPTGSLWMGGTAGRIYQLNLSNNAVIKHQLYAGQESANFIADILHDKDGVLWAASYGGGLFAYKHDAWQRFTSDTDQSGAVASNRVSALFEDRTGKKWIGTWRGLNFNKAHKAFAQLPLNIQDPVSTRTIHVDQEGIYWIGTEEQGLLKLTSEGVTVFDTEHPTAPLASSTVSALLEDNEGNLWVGSNNAGITILSPETRATRTIQGAFGQPGQLQSNQIYSIIQDRANRIWIGTVQAGLAMYDPVTNKFTTYSHDPEDERSIGSNEVITLYEDPTGQLWSGTIGGGLNRIDVRTTADAALEVSFTRYQVDMQDASSISSNSVLSLHRDEAGMLWVGTMGGGLNRFDPRTESFTTWNVQQGLSHANVTCILPDRNGYLWLPTSNGLTRFHPEKSSFKQYTVEDGLQSPVFYANGCADDEASNLYLPHTRGVTVFNPEEITHNPLPPTALIAEVLLFNEPLDMDSSALYKQALTLPHDQNFLAFELGATDYTIPTKNNYRYKLDGVDPDWVVDRGNRLANYPALNPGKYTFLVEATNNDGVWSDTRQMAVEILPPYWEEWWFRVLVALGIAGLVAGFFRYRQLQQKRLADTRQQIADDLHDDITGSLGALTFFLGRIRNSEGLSAPEKQSANDYLLSVQRMIGDLRDVVWLADPGNDNLGKLLVNMRKIGHQLAQHQRFIFEAPGIPEQQSLPMNMRRHLYLMYKEGLHNAVRHGEATTIEAIVTFNAGILSVMLKDDGKGFNMNETQKGQGLRSLRRRAKQSGITLSINAEEGAGTRIDLSIKIT